MSFLLNAKKKKGGGNVQANENFTEEKNIVNLFFLVSLKGT